MVTIYDEQKEVQQILDDSNDVRTTLAPNQFMAIAEYDAKRTVVVLGTAKCSYKTVYWRRNENPTMYKDFIVTIK